MRTWWCICFLCCWAFTCFALSTLSLHYLIPNHLSLSLRSPPHTPTHTHRGFQWLDRQFGKAATFRNAITKSLAGQLTLFPTYTPAFLLYSSLLEGSSLDQSIERVKQRLPVLLVTGSLYWWVAFLV